MTHHQTLPAAKRAIVITMAAILLVGSTFVSAEVAWAAGGDEPRLGTLQSGSGETTEHVDQAGTRVYRVEDVKGSTIRITPPSDTRESDRRARPFVRPPFG